MTSKTISNFPSITVIIATFNSEKTIGKALESVRNQEYSQKLINIILVDGGSSDDTLSMIKKYDVKIIRVPKEKQNAEYNKGVGVRKAAGDLLLMIDHDNVLPHANWLSEMVNPFLSNNEVVGVETLRYNYDPHGTLLDRYFALFGAGDPLAFYLGKADRLSYLYNEYNLLGKAIDKGSYYLVKFDTDHISTLGANGFLIKRDLLLKNAQIDENHFFHIDVNVDLIRKGFNAYAFVKNDIIHLTGYKSITSFLYRRKLFMEQFYVKSGITRRYSIYESKDKKKLALFIFFTLTLVKPLFDAMLGYIKIHDKAWFLHPFLCYAIVFIYSYVVIKTKIQVLISPIFKRMSYFLHT